MKIIPTILVNNFEDFKKQLEKMEGIFDTVQIDVMDGDFVPNQSFEDIEKINDLDTKIKFELHLMVKDPLGEMQKWTKIKNVVRVIPHVESECGDPKICIDFARMNGWEVGVALKPETPLFTIEDHLTNLDEVLILTVYPGRQGAPFVPEVKDKIKEFMAKPNHPKCAVDGHINKENIGEIARLGVDVACIGSAIVNAPVVKKAYDELIQAINN